MLLLVLAGTNSELLSVRKEFYFYLQKWLNSKAHKVNIQTKSLRYPYRLIKKKTQYVTDLKGILKDFSWTVNKTI